MMGCAPGSSCCPSCFVDMPSIDPCSDEVSAQIGAAWSENGYPFGGGMGELATSPQQAEHEKERVQAIALSVDAVMRVCYQVGTVQRAQWDATLAAWQAFYATPLGIFSGSFFGSGQVVDTAREFETRFAAFQKQAAADGCIAGPVIDPKDERNRSDNEGITSAVKFAAVAAVAVAAVIAIKSVI